MSFKGYLKLLALVFILNVGLNVYAYLSNSSVSEGAHLTVQVALCHSPTINPHVPYPSSAKILASTAAATLPTSLKKEASAIVYSSPNLESVCPASSIHQTLCYAFKSFEASLIRTRGPPRTLSV